NPRRTRVRLSPTGRLTRYRLVQDPPTAGTGDPPAAGRGGVTTDIPTHTTPEASLAAYGHAAPVTRWQQPPEPDAPQRRHPAGWTRVDEADDPTWRDWPWWRLLVRRGPLTAAPVARTAQEQGQQEPTTEGDHHD